MHRLRVRSSRERATPPLRLVAPALVAALIALPLALPAVASAANPTFSVGTASGTGEGEVECTITEPGEEPAEEEFCDGAYPANTKIAVFAEPEEHSEFVGFQSGTGSAVGCSGKKTCSFTLTANSTVEAIFDLEEFAFKVEKVGSGQGAVECEVEGTSGPCAAKYPYETDLILVAEAQDESVFSGWEGCEYPEFPDEGECELAIEEATTVKAIFTSTAERTLTVEETGPGTVTSSPAGISCGSACSLRLPLGATVTLTAAPSPGALFDGWAGGGCKGIAKTCAVTLGADTTVAAEFEPIPPPDAEEEEPLEFAAGRARAAGVAKVKAGKAALKLTCSGGPCRGTLKLTAKLKQGKKTKALVIGTTSFRLGEDTSKTVKVKLSGPAKRELGKGGTVKAKVSGQGVAPSTVKLRSS
jgi:Divergent InlB B-repeat domain